MIEVALVQFNQAGKTYYFTFDGLEFKADEMVVVETVRGIEVGRLRKIKTVKKSELTTELKPILRIATPRDQETLQENKTLIKGVLLSVREMVKKNRLLMKVIDAEYTLDRERLLIYFEAEQRVDFRDLVRDISEVYRTRIELRQIGSRDSAKIIGGIGPCGLLLCCSTFIGEFKPVSIRMAKNQNLSLNPQKISGVCGKLLCCIRYEDDEYKRLKKTLPDVGKPVHTPDGRGFVLDVNILQQKVKVKTPENDSIKWFLLSELSEN